MGNFGGRRKAGQKKGWSRGMHELFGGAAQREEGGRVWKGAAGKGQEGKERGEVFSEEGMGLITNPFSHGSYSDHSHPLNSFHTCFSSCLSPSGSSFLLSLSFFLLSNVKKLTN